jgi:hypothetical protein
MPHPEPVRRSDPGLRLQIDPATYTLRGAEGVVLTDAQFAGLRHPPCPACAHPVYLKARRPHDGSEARGCEIAGWACPNGCHRPPTPPQAELALTASFAGRRTSQRAGAAAAAGLPR